VSEEMDEKQTDFEEYAELLAGNYDALSLARALISATNRNIEHEIAGMSAAKPIGLMNVDAAAFNAFKDSPAEGKINATKPAYTIKEAEVDDELITPRGEQWCCQEAARQEGLGRPAIGITWKKLHAVTIKRLKI